MESPATTSRPLRFASFELDVRTRELRDGARRIRLQDQPFEILRLMLERPGDIVTRDELRERLWPGGTFVDFEHSLNAAVKRLRAVLGDDAGNPRFVETLPRRGYRFIARVDETAAPISHPPHELLQRLVVLPFTNLSDDAAQEYFSDGLTEELITQLGAMFRGRIGIVARWSSMSLKGTSQRARDIGQTLQVTHLLEGSVRCDADRVRITARLIEVASETDLWSESYERDLSEYCGATAGRLALQTDVAARVARAMAIELSANPRQRSGVHTLSPAGYQAYLKARYHWNNRGAEGLDDALAYFSQVVAREPAFADGHAAMARAHVASAEAYRQPPRHELELAHEAAARALALDPELSEAHLAIGETYRLLNWDWASAEDAYARAILLNPSNENARRAYSVLLVTMERRGEAVREAERACELDPMCLIASLNAAWVHYAVGDYDRAIERCRHALDMEARRIAAHRLLAAAYLQDGGWDRAIAALEAGLSIDANDPVTLASLAHARAIGGDTAAAEMIGARLSALDRYVPPLSLALVFTGLADLDAAFDALDTACVARDPMVAHVVIDPRFEPLRRDPRYSRLRTTLKLSSYP